MKNKTILFILLGLFYVCHAEAQRINMTINSGWHFHKGNIIDASVNNEQDNWEKITLPHTWNDMDAFDENKGYYRGVGWYKKDFSVFSEWKNKRVTLYFEGANQETEVFLNGIRIGEHSGGYTAFSFDISNYIQFNEKNTLMVKVNNQHNANIPPLNADFNFYGGIYRNVRLIVTDLVHFDTNNNASDGIFIETPVVSDSKATVSISGSIMNHSSKIEQVILETQVTDKNNKIIRTLSTNYVLKPNKLQEIQKQNIEILNPNLWSPDDPYLYKVNTRILKKGNRNSVLDEIQLPVGLRYYYFDDQNRFCLNGKVLKLIGTNRHQDFKGKGNALTDEYHWNDFKKIKELGFNFVRLAHYPQAKEVYRACDELGLLVWSEVPIVNEVTDSKEFTDNCLNMQREQIRQTKNHPSVIFYGYMNEIFIKMSQNKNLTEDAKQHIANVTVELAKKLEVLTKQEAPDRKTVMALHYDDIYNQYKIADIPDIIGWNLYFGWYYENLEDLSRFLTEQHNQYPNRPLIVSEFGTDTDIRLHTSSPMPWDFSENYQIKYNASYLKQMMNLPFLAGFAVWNFADFGSEGRTYATPFINQKGLVTYDRKEKEVCGLYKAYFSNKPVLTIALRDFTNQIGLEDKDSSGKCTIPVKIFSNGKEVELKNNGISLGKKVVIDNSVDFMVSYKDGENHLSATDDRGLNDNIDINFTLVPSDLKLYEGKELAINVGSKQDFFDIETNTLWMADKEYSSGSWGYTGGQPYVQNGGRIPKTGINNNILGTQCNPLFQTFNEGLENYRFDVADGSYVITLCFVEYNTKAPKEKVIYNLSNTENDKVKDAVRKFNISINGDGVIDNLNLYNEFGPLVAAKYDFIVSAKNGSGIKVDFQPINGKTILSGIKIKKI